MGLDLRKKIILTIWVVLVSSVSWILWNEDLFLGSNCKSLAHVIRSEGDVKYRSEYDTIWKPISGRFQAICDGDRISTGSNSFAMIEFVDGRMATIGEESLFLIGSIIQASGVTYIFSLQKGAISIKKGKVRSSRKRILVNPMLIRSGGRDYLIEPDEEKGLVKDETGVHEFIGLRKPITPKKESIQSGSFPN